MTGSDLLVFCPSKFCDGKDRERSSLLQEDVVFQEYREHSSLLQEDVLLRTIAPMISPIQTMNIAHALTSEVRKS